MKVASKRETAGTALRTVIVDDSALARLMLRDALTGIDKVQVVGNAAALAKTLVEFQKKHDVFELKGGYLDGEALDTGEIARLATLPNLHELRGLLVGLLVAPATKLVRLLNEPGAQLARLVEARRSALEESGGE